MSADYRAQRIAVLNALILATEQAVELADEVRAAYPDDDLPAPVLRHAIDLAKEWLAELRQEVTL